MNYWLEQVEHDRVLQLAGLKPMPEEKYPNMYVADVHLDQVSVHRDTPFPKATFPEIPSGLAWEMKKGDLKIKHFRAGIRP